MKRKKAKEEENKLRRVHISPPWHPISSAVPTRKDLSLKLVQDCKQIINDARSLWVRVARWSPLGNNPSERDGLAQEVFNKLIARTLLLSNSSMSVKAFWKTFNKTNIDSPKMSNKCGPFERELLRAIFNVWYSLTEVLNASLIQSEKSSVVEMKNKIEMQIDHDSIALNYFESAEGKKDKGAYNAANARAEKQLKAKNKEDAVWNRIVMLKNRKEMTKRQIAITLFENEHPSYKKKAAMSPSCRQYLKRSSQYVPEDNKDYKATYRLVGKALKRQE